MRKNIEVDVHAAIEIQDHKTGNVASLNNIADFPIQVQHFGRRMVSHQCIDLIRRPKNVAAVVDSAIALPRSRRLAKQRRHFLTVAVETIDLVYYLHIAHRVRKCARARCLANSLMLGKRRGIVRKYQVRVTNFPLQIFESLLLGVMPG